MQAGLGIWCLQATKSDFLTTRHIHESKRVSEIEKSVQGSLIGITRLAEI